MREIVVQNHGRPGHEMRVQLIGPRDRIIATGVIPASAFPADETFGEGQMVVCSVGWEKVRKAHVAISVCGDVVPPGFVLDE